MGARVLILGDRGREESIGWKLAQSKLVDKLYFAPGTGGTSAYGENVPIAGNDIPALLDFAQKQQIDLTVIGPELPSVQGLVDEFESHGLKVFGPTKAAAQLEASKAFTADFLERHNIPRPVSVTVDNLVDAQKYIHGRKPSEYVIKTSGLASGKGVIVPETQEEAEAALLDIMEKKIFGDSGNQIVFQERLKGQEVSAFALSDGQNIIMLPFFQDHKRIFNDNKGPNTGGMGAFSPLPFMSPELAKRIETEIMQPTIDGMRKDGTPYRGVLYGGLFVTETGEPKVIEFNCRFGDPECEPMMLLIQDDLYSYFKECAEGKLSKNSIGIKPGAAATVVLAAKGYPGASASDKPIYGLETVKDPDVVVFHSGTKQTPHGLVTAGGRVFAVTAYGADLKTALNKAYAQIGPKGIHFEDMHYRTDIGAQGLKGAV